MFIIQLINDFIQITGLCGDPEEKLAAEWIKWAPKVITYAKSERSAAIQKQFHICWMGIKKPLMVSCISFIHTLVLAT